MHPLTFVSLFFYKLERNTSVINPFVFVLTTSDEHGALRLSEYAINSEAYYLTPQAGYFEVVPNPSSKGQKCVSQVVLEPPIYWCFGGISAPNAVFGPGNWWGELLTMSLQQK